MAKLPSLRSAAPDGMSTEGKDINSSEVSFVIDYSGLKLGMKEARDLIADFGKELKVSMDGINKDKSSGFILASSDYSNAYDTSKVVKLPKVEAIAYDANEVAKNISAEGKAKIKRYIGSRVDTGTMKGSVYGRTYKGKDRVTAKAGWLDLWYKYFDYQESGTQYITPMNSMLRTYLELAPEVQKAMSQYLRNSTKGEGFKG